MLIFESINLFKFVIISFPVNIVQSGLNETVRLIKGVAHDLQPTTKMERRNVTRMITSIQIQREDEGKSLFLCVSDIEDNVFT